MEGQARAAVVAVHAALRVQVSEGQITVVDRGDMGIGVQVSASSPGIPGHASGGIERHSLPAISPVVADPAAGVAIATAVPPGGARICIGCGAGACAAAIGDDVPPGQPPS